MTRRSPESSLTTMTEIILPQHANALGTAFGGTVMSWVDICAAVAAQRHCGRVAVTAFVDEMAFQAPLKVGDVAVLTARVTGVFRTSLEVYVIVEREDPYTRERSLCLDAFLTFVNINDLGKPCPVPVLELETSADRKHQQEAEQRRAQRLATRKQPAS